MSRILFRTVTWLRWMLFGSFQAIEDAALAVMETYKALEGQLEEKKTSLTAMEKEFEKQKAVVAKARSAQVDVENELMVSRIL